MILTLERGLSRNSVMRTCDIKQFMEFAAHGEVKAPMDIELPHVERFLVICGRSRAR